MKAVIMAGGEGTRLRPLTSNTPKPMVPVVNRPMMEHIILLLRHHGFTEVVATVQFLASVIRNYFGSGSDLGVDIAYATETAPLGTAGSVRNAMDLLDETFLVISGDVVTDIDLEEVVAFHREKGAMATLTLIPVTNPLEFGIVITKEDGQIERFLEKPGWGQVFSDTINTGIYVLEPEIFDYIPADGQVDFSSDVFPRLLTKGEPLFGYVARAGYWADVGTLEAYVETHHHALDGQVRLDIDGFEMLDRVWVGEGVEIDARARIDGPAVIGDNSRVETGAQVAEYSVIGDNSIVKDDAYIHRSVLHDGVYVGSLARVRGAVVGKGVDLRQGVRIEEGAVLGDEVFVGDHAVISPQVKIYPFKVVEAGAIVNQSLVWESRGSRSLFGTHGVSGIANIDMTPELTMRLAMAYGTTLKKAAHVLTARDASRAARTLKRAAMVGLSATGVHCDDLEIGPVPVARFAVRTSRADGGIYVRTADDDSQTVEIRFFAADGTDLDEGSQRKIERLFYREDFRRAFSDDMGDILYPPRALEFYAEALTQLVDSDAARQSGLQVVVDYANAATAVILPKVLGRLGANVLSLNAYPDPDKAVLDEASRTDSLVRLSDLVRNSGAEFGALLEPGGEGLYLVDDRGRVLTSVQLQMLCARLMIPADDDPLVALPVSTSSVTAQLITDAGGAVVWSKVGASALMAHARAENASMALGAGGGVALPRFLPAFDGMAVLSRLVALTPVQSQALSKIVDELPTPHVVHQRVTVPFDRKGTVMRELTEATNRDTLLLDGVKVLLDRGWALVIPDPEEPVCHVWAEGPTEAASRALADEYVQRVRQLAG